MFHLKCWKTHGQEMPGATPAPPALSYAHADLKASARMLEYTYLLRLCR